MASLLKKHTVCAAFHCVQMLYLVILMSNMEARSKSWYLRQCFRVSQAVMGIIAPCFCPWEDVKHNRTARQVIVGRSV